MGESLSIILPLCNAQKNLAEKALQLLEVVAELTDKVDLVIVDDASIDDTAEVAAELGRVYPQIRLIRQPVRLGVIAAAKLGISETTGEIVLIHDIESPLSSEAIRQFWAMRDDSELVFARCDAASDRRGPNFAGSQRSVTTWSGTQFIRRRAINDLHLSGSPKRDTRARIDRVRRTDLGSSPPGSVPSSVLHKIAAEQDIAN